MTMRKFLHTWRLNRRRDAVIRAGEKLRKAQRMRLPWEELEQFEREHDEALRRFKEANA